MTKAHSGSDTRIRIQDTRSSVKYGVCDMIVSYQAPRKTINIGRTLTVSIANDTAAPAD